jgi:hypothetical protein
LKPIRFFNSAFLGSYNSYRLNKKVLNLSLLYNTSLHIEQNLICFQNELAELVGDKLKISKNQQARDTVHLDRKGIRKKIKMELFVDNNAGSGFRSIYCRY